MKSKKFILIVFVLITSFAMLLSQVDTWLEKGHKAMFQKKYSDAIKHFSKAIEIDSSLTIAYYNRGLMYLYIDNFEQALYDFNKVISLDSINADAFNNRGLALGFLGKLDESINDFNKAIQLDSNFSMSYFNRGNAYMSMNNDSLALFNFNKSIEIDSSNPAVFFQRGTILYSLNKYEQALSDFTKAISMGFRTPKAYYNLANANYKLKNYSKAVKNYNEVLKLDSNDTEALNNRAMAYDMLGQKVKAEVDRAKLRKISGRNKTQPPVETLKFVDFPAPQNYFSIKLPEGWNSAYSDTNDVIEINISPEPIKKIRDPYFTGVHLSLNLRMSEHWGKSDPDDLLEFWKGSVVANIKEYFGYKKYTEKYFNRYGYKGIMTNVQIQITEKSIPLVLYEYVLTKENVLFFAYFQAPVTEFAYYQKIFDKAIETLVLK